MLDPADAAQTETLTMLRKPFDLDETAYGYELRLQSACKMLLETDRTVTDIAQSCGFGTSSYFGMQLHAETGCTPTRVSRK